MPLAGRCTSSFSSNSRNRGRDYFENGFVSDMLVDGDIIAAVVEGSEDYDVVLDTGFVNDGEIAVSCTCPHFYEGNFCKHIWAAMIAADREGLTSRFGGSGKLAVIYQAEPDDRSGYDELEDPLPRTDSQANASKPPSTRWRQLVAQLEAVETVDSYRSAFYHERIEERRKPRRAFYFIDVSSSLSTDGLVIQPLQREKRKNGEWGKLKRIPNLDEGIEFGFDAEDRALLEMLSDAEHSVYHDYYAPYRYRDAVDQLTLSPVWYETLAPKLCATGRLTWGLNDLQWGENEPVRWDDGPHWHFRMDIAVDEDAKQWVFEGQLYRQSDGAEEIRPLSEAVLLLAKGLALFPDSLARFKAEAFTWAAMLRRAGQLRVPFEDRVRFLAEAWKRPLPEANWPPELALAPQSVPPRGRLVIHPQERRAYSAKSRMLAADVSFEYGSLMVPPQAEWIVQVDKGGEELVRRDVEAEAKLMSELAALDMQPRGYGYGWQRGEVQFPAGQLPHVVDTLVKAGWRVEAEGREVKAAGAIRMSVASGIDWFDLEGHCDFDGSSASLPELLAAARRGDKFVTLDDGSHGLLPEQWLARHSGLAELGEVADGRLRFSQSQALLLDSLLAAQEHVKVDRRFSAVRKKLQSFRGVKPSSPPRGFQTALRPYQELGLGWLHFLREFGLGGCLADDMGLGKTVQVLALLQARRQRRVPKGEARPPSLVVVPKSLIFNWIAEAERFAPNLRVLDYTGLQRRDSLDLFDESDVILTTYGTLRRDIEVLRERRFDYAILDESQAIKNANSQAAKACRLVQADHRLAMTGTPVENHLNELWSLFEFLNPGMLGQSSSFKSLSKQASSGDAAALDDLSRGLAPFVLRRTKEQVLDELPEKTEQTLYCEMAPAQRKAYNELRDYYRASLNQKIETVGLNRAKIHVLEALMRLRQAACHPGLLDDKKAEGESAKLDMLVEQLSEVLEQGHKALVFSQFTSFLSIVRKRLDAAGVRYEYLDGRTRDRQKKVESFQNDASCPVFLISLKAGGQGLNLTAADYVYILDPWWNPAVEAQAIDRAHRIGQERHVFAYRLICRDTVEDKILELQKHKRKLAEAIITADRGVLSKLSTDDLQLLLS